jgi:hypothetical protein
MSEKQPLHTFSKLAEKLVADLRRLPSGDPPRARKRPTQELPSLIEQLLQRHQIGRSAPEDTVRQHWPEIVGVANASYSHPARIERNRLIVLAAHSVVRNELFHHRLQIVSRLQQLPGCGEIKALIIRAG